MRVGSKERGPKNKKHQPKVKGFSEFNYHPNVVIVIYTSLPPAPPLIQSKASLTTLLIIAPPIRHTDNLATSKEQENQQQVKVIPSIKRRTHEIIIPRPQIIPIPESPKHYHKATDKRTGISSTDVSVKVGHTREEDGRVPEPKLQWRFREEFVQCEHEDWGEGADDEAVGEGFETALLEHFGRADEDVFDGGGEGGGEMLGCPLVCGILL